MPQVLARINSSRVSELLSELRQTEAWPLLEEYLHNLTVEAYRDLRDSEKWEDFLETRGSIKVLEYFMEFPSMLSTIAEQKKEEEELEGNGTRD